MVLLVTSGFSVKFRGQNVAQSCTRVGPGLAVPRRGAQYDFAGLAACIQKLRGAPASTSEEGAHHENHVLVSGNPSTHYADLVGAIETLHGAGIESFAFAVPR